MKSFIKNNRGISLIILMITMILMAILLGVVVRKIDVGTDIKNYDYMVADIELLESIKLTTEIEQFEQGGDDDTIIITSEDLHGQASPYDGPEYYVIYMPFNFVDVSLHFGGGDLNNKDVYIINQETNNIYYLKGVELEGQIYHRKK